MIRPTRTWALNSTTSKMPGISLKPFSQLAPRRPKGCPNVTKIETESTYWPTQLR